jgi:hypothetical protein
MRIHGTAGHACASDRHESRSITMRLSHKVILAIAVIVLLLLALAMPRSSAAQSEAFGDVTVRYSAISTDQLFADAARRYGIERSPRRGLVNVAVERRDGSGAMIAAQVTGTVATLAGRGRPIRFRETREEGAIDYLGEFAVEESGTHVFTIEVTPPGRAQPYTIRFNRDYVLD